jgi:predicted lipoprotein with Yx(FWY)xxD motif
VLAATLAVSILAGCRGGTGSSVPATGNTLTVPTPTTAPAATPTPTATAAPAAQPLVTAELLGSPGFVNKNSHTVYVFDADLAAPGTSTCNGQCASVWPPITVPAAANVPAPFAIIARSDGTSQLTYAGRPLYTYIADSAAGTTAGDGITSFGATWHVARPTAGTSTPAPTTSNPPVSRY